VHESTYNGEVVSVGRSVRRHVTFAKLLTGFN